MRVRYRFRPRRGAALVEFAVISPVVFFVILALFIGGMGVFRYQEVSHLAREGARYASTHGGKYQQDGIAAQSGVPAISSSADLSNYLTGKTVSLDSSKLQVSVSWTAPSGYTPANMPSYMDTNPNLIPPGQVVIYNNVIVTVTYQWFPELYLTGPITLSATSEMPMSY
jgi:Flp pilus assembly protein TadG